MPIIYAENLEKVFKVKTKQQGLKGSLRTMFYPDIRDIRAVKGISFSIEAGEKVAFIGPNGAGKSTLIKMLVGILYPTQGNIEVLNYSPWKDRNKLAFEIGTIFGQKSQLWYHLPPRDTFDLLAHIYELNKPSYKKRLEYLINLFDLEKHMGTVVKKLSLGERIKCEIVASLLHKPKILFLDEPTIGLDVIAKYTLRQLITKLNKEENITLFLTSHDVGDIEQMCERVIVINSGEIIYNNKVSTLKNKYTSLKTIKLILGRPFKSDFQTGVKVLKSSDIEVELEVDVSCVSIDKIVTQIMSENVILDLTIEDPPMEEIITRIYCEE
jgi:ABC-2 type transport system ATP-binding protein